MSATNTHSTDERLKLADRLDGYEFEGLDLHPRVLTELSGLMGLAAEALRAVPSETAPTRSYALRQMAKGEGTPMGDEMSHVASTDGTTKNQ